MNINRLFYVHAEYTIKKIDEKLTRELIYIQNNWKLSTNSLKLENANVPLKSIDTVGCSTQCDFFLPFVVYSRS